jgi:hypothetical protein
MHHVNASVDLAYHRRLEFEQCDPDRQRSLANRRSPQCSPIYRHSLNDI